MNRAKASTHGEDWQLQEDSPKVIGSDLSNLQAALVELPEENCSPSCSV